MIGESALELGGEIASTLPSVVENTSNIASTVTETVPSVLATVEEATDTAILPLDQIDALANMASENPRGALEQFADLAPGQNIPDQSLEVYNGDIAIPDSPLHNEPIDAEFRVLEDEPNIRQISEVVEKIATEADGGENTNENILNLLSKKGLGDLRKKIEDLNGMHQDIGVDTLLHIVLSSLPLDKAEQYIQILTHDAVQDEDTANTKEVAPDNTLSQLSTTEVPAVSSESTIPQILPAIETGISQPLSALPTPNPANYAANFIPAAESAVESVLQK